MLLPNTVSILGFIGFLLKKALKVSYAGYSYGDDWSSPFLWYWNMDGSSARVFSHHGMEKTRDKTDKGGRWYFSRKEIEENSPSRADGIDLKRETGVRQSYCRFLRELGMRLKVPQITIATATTFCHRFFLHQSLAKNDYLTIATACMFLAGKAEETCKLLKDVIPVSCEIIKEMYPAAAQKIERELSSSSLEAYEQYKKWILDGERAVLMTLDFDLNLLQPYTPLVAAVRKYRYLHDALGQVAWIFVNDGLHTSLSLQFKPHHVAAGALFLASSFLKVRLPNPWWEDFNITFHQLAVVSDQIMELYEQTLKPPSQEYEVETSAEAGLPCLERNTPSTNEESGPENGCAHGEAISEKPGLDTPSSTQLISELSFAYDSSGSQRSTQKGLHDDGSMETRSQMSVDRVDGELKDQQHTLVEPLPSDGENVGDTSDGPMLVLTASRSTPTMSGLNRHVSKNGENYNAIKESMKPAEGERYMSGSSGGQNLYIPARQLPQDIMMKIDKGKVKAALERRRKSHGVIPRRKKTELMDEDDLIERELEDGVELAVEEERMKSRKKSCSEFSNKPESETQSSGKDFK